MHLTFPAWVPKMLELQIAKANQRLVNSFANPLPQLTAFARTFGVQRLAYMLHTYSIQTIVHILYYIHYHTFIITFYQLHQLPSTLSVVRSHLALCRHCWALLGIAGQWEDRRSHTSHDLPTSLSLPNHERLMKTGQETLALGL